MVLYVPNIKDVFGLAGATVATLLMIVMPSGLHFKVFYILELTSSNNFQAFAKIGSIDEANKPTRCIPGTRVWRVLRRTNYQRLAYSLS